VGCGREKKQSDQVDSIEAAAEEPAADITEPEPNPTPKEVSFEAQVYPIFEAKCNVCHHPENAVKVDLTNTFDPEVGLINRPNTWTRSEKKILVVPGDPDASALIWKVEQTVLEHKVDGDPMPWHIAPLTDRELEDLRQWILQGAEDDELYRSRITRIFGDGVSLGSRGGKCSYCHYPGVVGPDLVDPFDPEGGAVNVSSYFEGVRIVPGDLDASVLFTKVKREPLPSNLGDAMPLHIERLTPEEIRILRDWISEGAKNN
jgi:mono/diheme cytochrome c family protein